MNKRSTKFYRKNEAEVMKRLGFKPTKNSGAGWVEKCDGQSENFICELKSTDKESYTLKQKTLQELEYHACVAHKTPVFALQFLNRDEIWVAIKEEDIQAYKELIERDVLSKLEEDDEQFLKKYKISKKDIDNQNKEEYYKGEKERGGFEANSFMPHTDDNSNSNRNSNIEQGIDVINGIDVNKVKHNINARNNYFKQKEQERRKQEQKFRAERRKTKQWKESYNKKG